VQGDDLIQEGSTSVESTTPAVEPSITPATESQSSETAVSESGEQSKESLLDAVQKVVASTEEPTVEGEKAKEAALKELKPEEGEKEEDDESNTETESSATEEVPESVPAPIKKKLRKLQKEALKYKHEVENLKPSAEIGQQLQNYASSNNLSSEDVVFALDLAAMVSRNDYESFYKVISPLIRHAQEVTGVVLPQDLQGMVEQQQMTPQAAAEFARTRFERAQYENQARQMQQVQETQQVSQVKDNVQRSVSAFEQRLAAQDPDYKAKADAVRRAAQAMLFERGGRISNQHEALQIVQAAYNEVNAQYRRIKQPVRATAPTPGASNPQTPPARSAPKNLMEAVLSGLAKSRAG